MRKDNQKYKLLLEKVENEILQDEPKPSQNEAKENTDDAKSSPGKRDKSLNSSDDEKKSE